MTLTQEDVARLCAPFPASDHEFHRGNCYLKEQVIATRLDEIDPAWLLLYDETIVRGDKVTVVVSLTVNQVTRVGVGQADVLYMKDSDKEANEAEKSAATDAFKRAARMFGIGRYILNMPKNISDERGLGQWLKAMGQPEGEWYEDKSNLDLLSGKLAEIDRSLTIEFAEVLLNKKRSAFDSGKAFYLAAIEAFNKKRESNGNAPTQGQLMDTDNGNKQPNQYAQEGR